MLGPTFYIPEYFFKSMMSPIHHVTYTPFPNRYRNGQVLTVSALTAPNYFHIHFAVLKRRWKQLMTGEKPQQSCLVTTSRLYQQPPVGKAGHTITLNSWTGGEHWQGNDARIPSEEINLSFPPFGEETARPKWVLFSAFPWKKLSPLPISSC